MKTSVTVAHSTEYWPALLTGNVEWHTAHTQDKTLVCPRKTRHEDCCGYCERYCQDKLTTGKQEEIELWAADVNRNMAAFTQVLPRDHTKQARMKYLKYSCHGTPDSDHGYGRITKPEWYKPETATSSNLSSYMSTANIRDSLPTRLSSRHTVPQPAHHSTDNYHNLSSRSSSNELLNVMTIDDAMSFQRQRHLSQPYSDSTNNRVRTAHINISHIPQDQIQERLQSIARFRCSSGQLEYDTHHGNMTAMRACDTMIQTRQVINNTSNQGLFKEQQFAASNKHICRKAESKRFQRLNDNLHRLIESDFLPDRKLQLKLQERSVREMTTDSSGQRVTSADYRQAKRQVSTAGKSSRRHDMTADTDEKSKERLLEMIMQIESPTDSETE